MPKNEALGLELRQIIRTDETAGNIIADAKRQRRDIERRTKAEKQQILADAAARREDMEKQVQAEQEAIFAARKAQAENQFEESRRRMEAILDEKHDAFKAEIIQRILQR